jgi:acylphosphatase
MTHKRVHAIIRGYVQGVGYRASCARHAQALGLTGWVRNDWDGSVEALFEGPTETVERMLAWCWRGPSRAEVTAVEVMDAPPGEPQLSFRIR